jgi:Fe-S cluster assembly iron-binding protein IscA
MVDTVGSIEGIRVGLGPSRSTNGASPVVSVVIEPAAGPLDEDETIVEDGIAVFVDPEVAPLLEDKLLDLAPSGSERVQFTLTERS